MCVCVCVVTTHACTIWVVLIERYVAHALISTLESVNEATQWVSVSHCVIVLFMF